MFQGSYYNRGARFIASRSSTYVGVHNYQNVLELPYYYIIFKPDVVIFDAAEYVFTDYYFDSSKMNEMDLNPSLSLESTTFDKIKEMNSNASVCIISGKKIDRIFFEQTYADARYAFFVANDEVFDFIHDENNSMELSLKHGTVRVGDERK